MKKVIYSVLLALLVFMPTKVLAAGYIAPSTSSLSIQQGSSASFTITAYNAIGDVSISSSNSSVAVVSASSWATGAVSDGQTVRGTITVTGVGIGSATITLRIDGATFDGEDLAGSVKTINVNVTAKPTVSPSTPSSSTTGGSTTTDTRSTNISLSKLTVNGKELTNSNNTFTLEVSNYIESADIIATAADTKATVSGTGSKTLNVGENSFNVIVTAEKGNTTTYIVKVIRKEYNTLADLDELLKLNKDVEIRIDEDTKLTKNDLEKISKSNNKVTLVKVREDNRILYSIILDGTKIKSVDEFNPNINMVFDNNSEAEEAFNYAEGIYFDFSNCGDIPKGIILRLYVGDNYNDDDKVNLYTYSSNKITQLKEGLVVSDGYVEFEITNAVKHFISKTKVLNAESNDVNIWFIVSMVLIGVIVLGGILTLASKTSKKKEKVEIKEPLKEEIKPIENTTKVEEPQIIKSEVVKDEEVL